MLKCSSQGLPTLVSFYRMFFALAAVENQFVLLSGGDNRDSDEWCDPAVFRYDTKS